MNDVYAFTASFADALTPEALSRALDAWNMRTTLARGPLYGNFQDRWTTACRHAKAAVLADADLSRPGMTRDQIWAAVAVAMDAAGAVAIREHINEATFQALYAPWSYMTGESNGHGS